MRTTLLRFSLIFGERHTHAKKRTTNNTQDADKRIPPDADEVETERHTKQRKTTSRATCTKQRTEKTSNEDGVTHAHRHTLTDSQRAPQRDPEREGHMSRCTEIQEEGLHQ